MRWVACAAVAAVMVATHGARANSAPAIARASGGGESLHIAEQHSGFLFGGDLFRRTPFSLAEWRWPPFTLTPSRVELGGEEAQRREQQDFLYFFGSDVWPHWAFAHSGFLWSPSGLDSPGLTVKLLMSGGVYRYRSTTLNNTEVIGRQYLAALLPGWRFKWSRVELSVFAGYEVQEFRLLPNDPGSRLRGRQSGIRAGFELWHEPNSSTMLAADLFMSSIGAGSHARIAYGWRIFDWFYLGPEAQAYYTDPYGHTRFGLHVTSFKALEREWTGAFGYAGDSDNRSGYYARLGLLMRR